MIEFETPVRDMRLLRKCVEKAQTDKDYILTFSDLVPKRELSELTDIGRSWQDAGLGRLTERFSNGVKSVSFSLDTNALEVVEADDKRKIFGRLKMVPRSEWIALAAFVVSLVALFKWH